MSFTLVGLLAGSMDSWLIAWEKQMRDETRGVPVAPDGDDGHTGSSWEDLESPLSRFEVVSRKQRDYKREVDGAELVGSRWQILVEKP